MSRQPTRWVALVVVAILLAACSSGPPKTPLQKWLAHKPLYIAHRGGDADWPEATAYAYSHAAAWNRRLALEVPVWRTSDGVWVVSEDATTARVFGAQYRISTTPWSTLAGLRTRQGGYPMLRLTQDVLDVYGRSRILFVDDKADTDAAGLLDLLGKYAGPSRYVIKCYWHAAVMPALARSRGYLTWGYYYPQDMVHFAATSSEFDLIGLDQTASTADFAIARATGKPVIAFVVKDKVAGRAALGAGATGLMVSGVQQVVPK